MHLASLLVLLLFIPMFVLFVRKSLCVIVSLYISGRLMKISEDGTYFIIELFVYEDDYRLM